MNKYIALTACYNAADILPKFFSHIRALAPAPSFHIFVTNNCKDKTNELIDKYLEARQGKRITYILPDDYPKRMNEPYVAIALARQRLLREARVQMLADSTLTHAIFIDDDVMPKTKDAFDKTANWGKDITGGTYYRYFPEGKFISSKWLDISTGGRVLRSKPRMPLDQPHITSAGWLMLTRKAVMDERLRFFPIYKPNVSDTSEDFGFCMLARSLGYIIWLDSTVILDHVIRNRNRPWVRRSDNLRMYIPFRFSKPFEQDKATRKLSKKRYKEMKK